MAVRTHVPRIPIYVAVGAASFGVTSWLSRHDMAGGHRQNELPAVVPAGANEQAPNITRALRAADQGGLRPKHGLPADLAPVIDEPPPTPAAPKNDQFAPLAQKQGGPNIPTSGAEWAPAADGQHRWSLEAAADGFAFFEKHIPTGEIQRSVV